jgi:predicted Zn-dependent protease
MPASQLTTLGNQAYADFLRQHEVIRTGSGAASVRRVGRRIRRAVEAYLRRENALERIAGYEWEFVLAKDGQVNAFALPGGKVVVYSGMLPVAGSDAGLAVVVGHEIAHVVAGHHNERVSQATLQQLGAALLSEAVKEQPGRTRQVVNAVYGIGSTYGVMLPYSRLQEHEADRLGLIFMAMAGYDPGEGVAFWERMNRAKAGRGAPAFLSTHPTDTDRIRRMRETLPEARKYLP